MTTATIDQTTAAVRQTTSTCPNWCDGTCETWYDEIEGSRYHASQFDLTTVSSVERENVEVTTSVTRLDLPTAPGATEVHILLGGRFGEDFGLSPAESRRLAAMLLNAADLADPMPLRVAHIQAQDIRVGDEIDTPDGWQPVHMILVDARAQHVGAFTDQRDETDTDGWQFVFGDIVIVRRPRVHRSRRRTVTR